MYLVAASLLLASPLIAADYHLTFDDEFNSFNDSRWHTADFFGMRTNGEDFQGQWFADPNYVPKGSTQKPYNAFSSTNGVLTIRAQPTPDNTFSGAIGNSKPQPYVSGQITTAHKFTQRYGYYELVRQTHHRIGLALPRRRCARSQCGNHPRSNRRPSGSPKITRTLIDEGHSNSYNAWRAMGSPQSPTEDQIRELQKASQLAQATDKTEVRSADGHSEITFSLARRGVTLVELEWP